MKAPTRKPVTIYEAVSPTPVERMLIVSESVSSSGSDSGDMRLIDRLGSTILELVLVGSSRSSVRAGGDGGEGWEEPVLEEHMEDIEAEGETDGDEDDELLGDNDLSDIAGDVGKGTLQGSTC